MALLDRPGADCEDLRAVDELQKVLNEYEYPERGYEEYQVGGFLLTKRAIDQPIYSDPDYSSENRGKKKADYRVYTELDTQCKCQIRPGRIDHPVRQMEESHGLVYNRKSQRNQRVDATGDKAVEENL